VAYRDYGGIHCAPLGNPSIWTSEGHLSAMSIHCYASESKLIDDRKDRVSPGRAIGRATVPININAISVIQHLRGHMLREAPSETCQIAEGGASSAALYIHWHDLVSALDRHHCDAAKKIRNAICHRQHHCGLSVEWSTSFDRSQVH
jgi:hypothetical protein